MYANVCQCCQCMPMYTKGKSSHYQVLNNIIKKITRNDIYLFMVEILANLRFDEIRYEDGFIEEWLPSLPRQTARQK